MNKIIIAAAAVIAAAGCAPDMYRSAESLAPEETAQNPAYDIQNNENISDDIAFMQEEEMYRAAAVYSAAKSYLSGGYTRGEYDPNEVITIELLESARSSMHDEDYEFDEGYKGYKIFKAKDDYPFVSSVEWESEYFPDGKGIFPGEYAEKDIEYSSLPDTVNISPYSIYDTALAYADSLAQKGEWSENSQITLADLKNAGLIKKYPKIHYLIITDTVEGKPQVKYVEWFSLTGNNPQKVRYPQKISGGLYWEYSEARDIYNKAVNNADKLEADNNGEITIDSLVDSDTITYYPRIYYTITVSDGKIIKDVTWTSLNGKQYKYPRDSYTDTQSYKTAGLIFNAAQAYATDLAAQDKWPLENNSTMSVQMLIDAGYLPEGTETGFGIMFKNFYADPTAEYVSWTDEDGMICSYPEKSRNDEF